MGAEAEASPDRTVLVVDDLEPLRDVARAALEAGGHTVRLAESGEQALDLLERHGDEIAAVVLDMGLPGLGGEKTYRRLRERHADLPVVIVSGDPDVGRAPVVREDDGPHVFLAKPFSPAELRHTVAGVLAG